MAYLVVVRDVEPRVVGDHVVMDGEDGLRVGLDPGNLGTCFVLIDNERSLKFTVAFCLDKIWFS